MDIQFSAEEWRGLSQAQRVARCQALAAESQRLGQGATDDLKAMYLDLTIQWLKLAKALEESAQR
jgi:hypothetical protein